MFNYGAYVALVDTKDAIVGSIGIEPNQEDKTVCIVNVFAVEKDCRNCGFGKILLDFAVELARQLRFRSITIYQLAILDLASLASILNFS